MKHFKLSIAIGALFLVTGIVMSAQPLYDMWRNSHGAKQGTALAAIQKVTPPSKPVVQKIEGTPTHISIPSVGISLDIIDGKYYPSNGTWTLSLNKAQFADMTAKPNNVEGNTFIYAHNRYGVFHTLPQVGAGSLVYVTTDTGHTFTYSYATTTTTSPTDTSLFAYQGAPILTLQTCTGSFYQNRSLYIFNLVKVA
jgi:LPXTG-site transpeptidase (sortase) family protein